MRTGNYFVKPYEFDIINSMITHIAQHAGSLNVTND